MKSNSALSFHGCVTEAPVLGRVSMTGSASGRRASAAPCAATASDNRATAPICACTSRDGSAIMPRRHLEEGGADRHRVRHADALFAALALQEIGDKPLALFGDLAPSRATARPRRAAPRGARPAGAPASPCLPVFSRSCRSWSVLGRRLVRSSRLRFARHLRMTGF